jgi:Clp amino terminal domain, pathogenicity island component
MSESSSDAQLGCEVRALLADGSKTTLQAKELVIRLGDGTNLEFDLRQFRINWIGVACEASLSITPHAANSISISTGRFWDGSEPPGARAEDPLIDQLVGDRPFTDSAVHLLDNLLPFNPKFGAPVFNPEWVCSWALLALMRGPRKVGKCTLEELNVDMTALGERMETHLRSIMPANAKPADPDDVKQSFAAAVAPLLDAAATESQQLNHKWIGTEHLLLAAVKRASPELSAILREHSLAHETVREKVVEILTRRVT